MRDFRVNSIIVAATASLDPLPIGLLLLDAVGLDAVAPVFVAAAEQRVQMQRAQNACHCL